MASEATLCIHHVGGRGGQGPFPLPPQFVKDAQLVYYDADPDSVDGMGGKRQWVKAIPLCVGRDSGRVTFNITHNPHASSLLELNTKFAEAYFPKIPYDSIFGIMMHVTRRLDVEIDSMDSAIRSGRYDVPAPDILSLDTEGSEFDILEGAKDLLDREVLCVVSEVAFMPIRQASAREDQKLFGDITAILSRHGFIFVRVQPHGQELSLYRGPVGLRGRGLQGFADAVYLKEIDLVEGAHQGTELAIKLRKLAMAALVFGQLEYALECLRRARQAGLPSLAAPPSYWAFLDALESEAAKVKARYYPTLLDFDPYPDTAADSATGSAAAAEAPARPAWKQATVDLLARWPAALGLARRSAQAVRALAARGTEAWRKRFAPQTAIERLLAANGFGELSESVRLLRLRQEKWCRS
jgi:FkbM family methyltransferase